MAGDTFLDQVIKLKNRKFYRFGIPFLALVLGGSFGLKQFTNLRYQFRKRVTITEEEAAEYGVKMKAKKTTLQNELDKIEESNIDTWDNIRGPRPWEDSKTVQDLQRVAKAKLEG